MFGGILALLAVALVAVGVMIVTLPRRHRQIAADEAAHPALGAYRVTTGLWRALGAVAGVVVATVAVISQSAWNGRGLGLVFAPIILGLALMVAVLVGDMFARGGLRLRDADATGSPRYSDERVRVAPGRVRFGDLMPTSLLAAVGATTLVLVGLLIGAWATGSPDSRGKAGRLLTVTSADGIYGRGRGPWPGEFYGIWAMPLVLVLLGFLAVCLLGVWLRRRVTRVHGLVEADDIVRRSEAEALVASVGVAISLLTAGVAGTMASILIGTQADARLHGYDVGVAHDAVGWLLVLVALAATALTVFSTISLLIPGYGAPHLHRHERTVDRETAAVG